MSIIRRMDKLDKKLDAGEITQKEWDNGIQQLCRRRFDDGEGVAAIVGVLFIVVIFSSLWW